MLVSEKRLEGGASGGVFSSRERCCGGGRERRNYPNIKQLRGKNSNQKATSEVVIDYRENPRGDTAKTGRVCREFLEIGKEIKMGLKERESRRGEVKR